MKFTTFAFFLIISLSTFAQSKINDTSIVLGLTNNEIYTGMSIDANGFKVGEFKMKMATPVYLIGAKSYKIHTGKIFDYYEVAYRGKSYFAYRENINVLNSKYTFEDLLNIPINKVDTFRAVGLRYSNLYYLNQKLNALKFIESCKSKGLVITKNGIYDESEYTEGTSFSCTIENLSNKTVKYISFSLVGYNAVGDKVSERGVFTKVVKGIGPLEKGASGAYEFDYVWFTDLVETFDIVSIKIQYMDGTIKVISNPKTIKLSKEHYDLINEEN